jgi:Uma2 family endonuclease
VREYWIIDPRPGRRRADFYRLDDAGDYELFATDEDDRVESAVLPGFWLRPSWLWMESRPRVIVAFLEILSPEQREKFRGLLGDN